MTVDLLHLLLCKADIWRIYLKNRPKFESNIVCILNTTVSTENIYEM